MSGMTRTGIGVNKMTNPKWVGLVHQARRSAVGVTPEGIVVLRANAHAYGYAVDEDGRVIDPETGVVVVDTNTLEPIMKRAERQMVIESQIGEDLLKKVM